ncbi:FAD/NAD(P)-binding domain-containing protein, partial [Mycena galopus ATCC 62051]
VALAQGLKKRGIKATVFERDPDEDGRTQGWCARFSCFSGFQDLLPEDLYNKLDSTAVDTELRQDEGHFMLLDGRDCSTIYDIPPSKRRLRANRSKLRKLLLTGLNIEYSKRLASYEITPHGVKAIFTDGSSATGMLLVGADGNNSTVRHQLKGPDGALNDIPVCCYGGTQKFTPEQVAPLRKLDPLLFQTMNPDTNNFIWYSIQNISDDRQTFEVLTIVSHLITDPKEELAADATNAEMVADMKKRNKGFCEPFHTLIHGINPDTFKVTKISLRDWIPLPWVEDAKGRVTLVGDAAGPMTMYRGEGVNHGLLDAANLAEAMLHVKQGKISQADALAKCEAEIRARRAEAIPLSRQAAIDAHSHPQPTSPLVTRRAGPDSAQRKFD